MSLLKVVYGLLFDLKVLHKDNISHPHHDLYGSECWNNSLQLRIENGLSREWFNDQYLEREEMNEGSYGGSDSGSWLLSLLQSLLLSLLLWQPLTIWLITWLKIWMFTYVHMCIHHKQSLSNVFESGGIWRYQYRGSCRIFAGNAVTDHQTRIS